MTGSDTRQKFLDYFAARGHRIVRSSSLVPANDPTLLFTNAGMNQFKDVFLGEDKRDYARATTSQKCVRAGGKHNDLDNVGYTRRHHTFFEMLGNFSFGDYFKREAIDFAWELITKEYGLPKDRLYVTVFREDDDAENLWQEVTGIPKCRIFRLDEKDNFWQMGDTGPCGPCSEIHYDFGEIAGPGEFPHDPGERFVEIWNLVFMQFDRDSTGKMTPLPRPSIDTGMGLERIAAVMQGVISNYDTDLIHPIIHKAAELFGKTVGDDARSDTVLRINADHARATAFLINDGVVPSNEGRGYVLRKIMRRAMRNARMLGTVDPYLFKLTGFVAEHMRDAYPEMIESIPRVARVVKDEEHRYATTFMVAEKVFHDEAKTAVGGVLPGAASFKLYDTYGLALDEQEEMAREAGVTIDREGFQAEMEKQRTSARASWKGADKAQVNPVYQALPRTEFIGRETLESPATVTAVITTTTKVGQVPDLPSPEPRPSGSGQTPHTHAEIALDKTPFYAEAGGQVGDTGVLLLVRNERANSDHRIHLLRRPRQKRPPRQTPRRPERRRNGNRPCRSPSPPLHHAQPHRHAPAARRPANRPRNPRQTSRQRRRTLRLRFDFTHYTAMDADELAEVERLMNEQILLNREVTTNVMDLDQALSTGAMALFGEKYGDKVRVVSIADFSKELCGGTHVSRTGDIGVCKIVYEGSISAGVRRIEAITGEGALRRFQDAQKELARVASIIHAPESELVEQVEKLLAKEKSLETSTGAIKEQSRASRSRIRSNRPATSRA